jgi:hypothetical protein
MARDQDLNSLSRFRKQSGRLVLEVHSHCEVPAGCGGVVLRWRNPFAAVPLRVHLYTPAPAVCFLDGAEVQNGRVDLAPERHAVAFALDNVDLSAGLILFAAVHPETRADNSPPPLVDDAPLKVVTADDGTWKCTLQEPATNAWHTPAFDDRDWVALTQAPKPQLGHGTPGAYQCDRCARLGAVCLRLPKPGSSEDAGSWWRRWLGLQTAPPEPPVQGSVWIRKVFDIPPPQTRAPS